MKTPTPKDQTAIQQLVMRWKNTLERLAKK